MAEKKDTAEEDFKPENEATETVESTGLNGKEMLEKAVKEKRVIKYNDRMKVEILKDTKYYKKGETIEPHVLVAEQLIKEKTAKAV